MAFKQWTIFWVIAVLSITSGLLNAQTPTGDIIGTVTDETGGVIQEGTVTATNTRTGMVRMSNTGEDGRYRIAVLPPRGIRGES
ncbi:carboxypeptidase-like regulatory domain-containing protein [Acidobacteria bacterium AH-259-G07]|nr:carboxypeptidase-like regulatory domain-containing protein [Acidobacteria bacterium AH-259-G07]